MMGSNRARSLGWMAVLAGCFALVVILSFKVHAVKSEVLLAERQVIALERETLLLETEFQTRASQRQLSEWNTVEFGYAAPRAGQFLDGERQLASLGQRPGPDAPAPIRLARADSADATSAAETAMLTSEMLTSEMRSSEMRSPPMSSPPMSSPPMRSPLSGAPVTFASAASEPGAGEVFSDAFGDFLIEASPIRPARAQSAAVGAKIASAQGAGE